LNRRLVGLQRWSGCFVEEINALLLPQFESHIIQLIVRNYSDRAVLAPLSRKLDLFLK
jgi:hypothetical protein